MPGTVNLIKSYDQETTDEEELVLLCSTVMMSNCPLDTHVYTHRPVWLSYLVREASCNG